jgi:hypothetical protein
MAHTSGPQSSMLSMFTMIARLPMSRARCHEARTQGFRVVEHCHVRRRPLCRRARPVKSSIVYRCPACGLGITLTETQLEATDDYTKVSLHSELRHDEPFQRIECATFMQALKAELKDVTDRMVSNYVRQQPWSPS